MFNRFVTKVSVAFWVFCVIFLGILEGQGEVPVLSSLSVSLGVPGQVVTLSGQNLVGITGVFFGAIPATFTSKGLSSLAVTVPPTNVVGTTVPVYVTLAGGSQSNSLDFTYTSFRFVNPPLLTSIQGNVGFPNGGYPVLLHGTNFTNGGQIRVFFGPQVARIIKAFPQALIVIAPAISSVPLLTSAAVVVATNNGFSNSLPFTYSTAAPVITALTPNHGAPGTVVTISGINFTPSSQVFFNFTPATQIVFQSPRTLLARVPVVPNHLKVFVTVKTSISISNIFPFKYQ